MFLEITQAHKYILNSSKCIRFLSKCSVFYFYQVEDTWFYCQTLISTYFLLKEIFNKNPSFKNFVEKILIFIPNTKFLLNLNHNSMFHIRASYIII